MLQEQQSFQPGRTKDRLIRKISDYEGSTLLGMNGGQPESPDGKLIVYAKKPDITETVKQETQIWVCDRETLTDHRHIATVRCGNHNGPSATFVDNEHIVFRDSSQKLSSFQILNVYTGKTLYGPILAKESLRRKRILSLLHFRGFFGEEPGLSGIICLRNLSVEFENRPDPQGSGQGDSLQYGGERGLYSG